MLLCDIISKHSDNIKSINVDKIIRGGLTQFRYFKNYSTNFFNKLIK